jgi:L,D-peptidoglycan transpeptidase YkuD (ErfK/YbiS/YcfS/YnhG family)
MIRVDTHNQKLVWLTGETQCALGKHGTIAENNKREGDGKTPLGIYPLRMVYYRADRIAPPTTILPTTILTANMGWCDASNDINYNKFITHPYAASAEHLWREDGLYDIIVTLGHNDAPVAPNFGSAIFLHCCKYDDAGGMKPTLGCVVVAREVLVAMLAEVTAQTLIEIF